MHGRAKSLLDSAAILGGDGPLAGLVEGFVPRRCQQEMAARIETALADKLTFIAESGTGTGKTFAYLVPALLSGKKVLISTGTRNLQDQLYTRDLPLIRKALPVPVTAALLKGRANYLCLHRLATAESEGRPRGKQRSAELVRIREWAGRTRVGDIAEVGDVPEQSAIWMQVTSTADNCLGAKCPNYNECFVNRARREALAADVLVVNHHLFFADLVLREDGFGQLLPGVEAVIFDEAHQLPEVASNFFGISIGGQQLLHLCRDTVAEELKEHSAVPDLKTTAQRVEKAVADFRLTLGVEPRRAAWNAVAADGDFQAALAELILRLTKLTSLLEKAAVKGEGLASCWRRTLDSLDRLHMVSESRSSEYVRWFETTGRTFTLRLTPIDIGAPFRERLAENRKAWVLTSATLAVDGSFTHFQSQLGLDEGETGLWDSPFDYATQALLYLPQGLPLPRESGYTQKVVERALPVLQASRGRAFMLFTSHRALNEAAPYVADRIEYPVLVQGDAPRSELLARFRADGHAVLLGTASFWGGVDVRGDALSCVIIDKLPFASPADPVLQARGAAMEAAGRSPFVEYQLPNAVIALKQGVGRLIRDIHDCGVLMICDPRLLSKGYGRVFLNSLPDMPITRDIRDVQKFFKTA